MTYIFKEDFADPVIRYGLFQGLEEGLLETPQLLDIRKDCIDTFIGEDLCVFTHGFDESREGNR